MKKTILFVLFAVTTSISNAQDIINYFQVGDDIVTPVTIHTSKGKFTIYGGERIDGNLYGITAYDANGNKIVQNTPYKTETATGEPTVRYYYFKSIYNSSSNNYDSYDSSYNESDSYDNDYSSGAGGSNIAEKMGNYARQASRYHMDGYPNLQIRVGYSYLSTEALSIKIQLGGMGGFNLSGGVGYDLFHKSRGWTLFYGGVGYYSGDTNNDISFNVLFGASLDRSFFLCGELEYSYFFDAVPRLGLFVAGRLGVYFSYSFMFDAHAGISWKLFK